MKNELKPCPFCGDFAKKIFVKNSYGKYGEVKRYVSVGCTNNDCFVKPSVAVHKEDIDIAIEQWNRRAQ
jgi:hypothetical protein